MPERQKIFSRIKDRLLREGQVIIEEEMGRPWGGFFVLDEKNYQCFADIYFKGIDVHELRLNGRLSPKILIIEPGKRLSWQYHYRRREIWKVVHGCIGVIRSLDDIEGNMETFCRGQMINLSEGERHRIVGLTDWAEVAEIWQHTISDHPSDEEDIVRLNDDFGR